jgi:hypothetical protein
MAETDNPWKTALDELFPLAMRSFLPEDAERVAWYIDYESRETELRPLLVDSQTGTKSVDKLVKLWFRQTDKGEVLSEGAEEVEYYHFEVQYRKEDGFEKRMSEYNDVARVHLRQHVIAVAILGDEDPTWLPSVSLWGKSGCSLRFEFRPIKLLDWRGKEQELLQHDNPFALFVLAHVLIVPTQKDEEARAGWKLRLWQRACEHTMEQQDLSSLLRLIDWMLLLPTPRNRAVLQQFHTWREKNPMPFVSVFEQEILEQKQQVRDSCLDGIALGLKLKFGEQGEALLAEVQKQTDLDWLRRFLKSIEPAASLDDLRKLLT